MLSPEIDEAQADLAACLNTVLALDSYAYAATTTTVGVLAPDPEWLAPVRSRLALLGTAGSAWTLARPDIWASVLHPFAAHAAAVESLAALQTAGSLTTAAQWEEVLTATILPSVQTAHSATAAADSQLAAHDADLGAAQTLLTSSIEDGWVALAAEEAQMVAIATKLGELHGTLTGLEEKVTSASISSGRSYVTSSVSLLYGLLTAAEVSIPFLGTAALAVTVGVTFYDLVTGTDEIDDLLQQIGALQLEASVEAQAVAGTKAVIQMLYDRQEQFVSLRDSIPTLTAMWEAESSKASDLIDALRAGADPTASLEILTLPVAAANWGALATTALDLVDPTRPTGPPVELQVPTPA